MAIGNAIPGASGSGAPDSGEPGSGEPGTTGRRGRRKVTTRRRLLDAARGLVGERGLDGLTVAEVTEAADVGFGTFYGYFATRDELVDALLTEAVEQVARENDELASSLDDPAERIALGVRNTITSVDRDPVWAAFLVRTAFSERPQVWAALNERMLRDVAAGVGAGRFVIGDLPAAPFLIGGAVLGVLRGKLDGFLGPGAEMDAAAAVLLLLGLARSDAVAVAHRPLPGPDREAS